MANIIDDKFGAEGFSNAYFGDKGLSLSNRFIVDNIGSMYAKRAYFGGNVLLTEKETTDTDSVNIQTSVASQKGEGWELSDFRIYSQASNGKIIDISNYNTQQESIFCIGANATDNSYIRAPFRILKNTGSTVCADPQLLGTSGLYGTTPMLQVIGLKNNNSTYTPKLKTYIYANRIYMENTLDTTRVSGGEDPLAITSGSIYFIPGGSYNNANRTGKKGNSGHFYFSRPICANYFRLSAEGINYLSTTTHGSKGWVTYSRTFRIGPSQEDIDSTGYTRPPALTVLRGKHLNLVAYGTKGGRGYINTDTKGIFLPNNTALWGRTNNSAATIAPSTKAGKRLIWVENEVKDIHISSGDKDDPYRRNRVVVGGATNAGHLEIRSGNQILLKCGGMETDGRDYSSRCLQFAYLDFGSGSSKKLRGCLRPLHSGYARLGSSSFRWYRLYTTKSASVSSDRRKKYDIETLLNNDKYLTFFNNLNPTRFKWKDNEQDGFTLGFIAQEVEEALLSAGLTREDFASLEQDDDGFYSLAYEDFISLCVAKIKNLEDELQKEKDCRKQLEQDVQKIKEYLQLD